MDDGKPVTVPQQGLLDTILSLVFPVRCVHCRKPGALLCPDCTRQLKPITSCCPKCGAPRPDHTVMADHNGLVDHTGFTDCPECHGRDLQYTQARAAFRFEGPARSLVHALKYSGQHRIARFMADLSLPALARYGCTQGSPLPARSGLTHPASDDKLTYVPLHQSKLLTRGYNQAAIYAQAVSRRLGLPLVELLEKHRPTPSQNQLGYSERRKNLSESFRMRRSADLAGAALVSRIVLVDDVYTTGSTAAECAALLHRELGAIVEVWTFARTARD